MCGEDRQGLLMPLAIVPTLLSALVSAPPVLIVVEGDAEEAAVRSAIDEVASHARTIIGPGVLLEQLPACATADTDGCAARRGSELGASGVVLLRAVPAITRVRVILRRPGSRDPAAIVDLPEGRWSEDAVSSVRRFFEPLRAVVVTEPAPDPPSRSIAPWITLGAGAALGATGVALGVSSRSAHDDLARGGLSSDDTRALSDRMSTHGSLANVLFVGTAICVGGSLAWLVLSR